MMDRRQRDPPVITLTGNATETVECGTAYVDAGATATDICDGGLVVNVAGLPIDTSSVGSHTVTYTVSDGEANASTPALRTVNVDDTDPPVETPPVEDPPVEPPAPEPEPDVFHVVKDGETPWGLAMRYLGDGNRADEILAANPGVSARNLRVGMRLRIPARGAASVRPAPDVPATGDFYIVKEGDSLWRIAQDLLGNGAQFPRILEANRDVLSGDGSNLDPGTRLRIPR